MHYIECKYIDKIELLDLNLLLLFTLSSIALTLFPGPDLFFVLSTSLAKGWKKGVLVSLGLTSGLWVHTLLVILGIGNLLAEYPESLRILECIGGFYLLFLAFRLVKSNRVEVEESLETIKVTKQHYYYTGLIMNLTNPKVSLFFISFFPGFLFHESWSYGQQFFLLGTLFFLQALLIFISVSLVAGQLGKKFAMQKESPFWNKFQAVVLALIALVLIYP